MAELVDALDLGSSDESRGGSNPSARTTPGPAVCDPKWPPSVRTRSTHCQNGGGRSRPDGEEVELLFIDNVRSSYGSAHASHRNLHRRPQARVPRRRAGERSLGSGHRPPDPDEGSGQNQRLSAGQGAGRPSQARLRPRGDGRDHRAAGARDQRQDRLRSRAQARDGSQDHDDGGQGRDRERHRGQDRSRLHGRRRGGAADHARRLQVGQARAGHRAGVRPGGRRRAAEDRDAEPPVCGEGGGKHGRERGPGDDLIRRLDRRRAVRRRAPATTFPITLGSGHVHSRLRGPAHRHRARRKPHGQRHLPGELPTPRNSPARRPRSR